MKLSDHIKAKGLTEAEFGALIGVSQPMVNKYCNGKAVPRPPRIKEIEQVSGGDVTFSDWFNSEDVPA